MSKWAVSGRRSGIAADPGGLISRIIWPLVRQAQRRRRSEQANHPTSTGKRKAQDFLLSRSRP